MPLRRALPAALPAPLPAALSAQAASVTDLAGRQVELPARAGRVILGESRLPVPAILEKGDPAARVLGNGAAEKEARATLRMVHARFQPVPLSGTSPMEAAR